MKATIMTGDVLKRLRELPDESVHCVVTSPPYWGLRDYGVDGQIGLEATPTAYLSKTVEVFREVRRVLRKDGTCWVNMGDCYATGAGRVGEHPGGGKQGNDWAGRGTPTRCDGSKGRMNRGPMTQPNRMPLPGLKPKDLVGMPWRLAFALQDDGWYLRQDIIWHKPAPMPESVKDRCTKAHEYLFLLARSRRYHFDVGAISEPVQFPEESTPEDITRAFSARRDTSPEQRQGPLLPEAYKGSLPGRSDGPGQDRRSGQWVSGWAKKGGDHSPIGFTRADHPNRVGKLKTSGNKERKLGSARGCPEGTGSNVCGSVPWEGLRRNKRSVWSIASEPFAEAHFATYPQALVEPCILAGCPPGGGGPGPVLRLGNDRRSCAPHRPELHRHRAQPRIRDAGREANPRVGAAPQ